MKMFCSVSDNWRNSVFILNHDSKTSKKYLSIQVGGGPTKIFFRVGKGGYCTIYTNMYNVLEIWLLKNI